MIRALILWLAKRLLAKYVSAALADRIVEAASEAFDEIKANGAESVSVAGGNDGSKRIVIRPADPGAKPVTLDDILKSENNPAG